MGICSPLNRPSRLQWAEEYVIKVPQKGAAESFPVEMGI